MFIGYFAARKVLASLAGFHTLFREKAIRNSWPKVPTCQNTVPGSHNERRYL